MSELTWADLDHSELSELVITAMQGKGRVNKHAWVKSRMRPRYRTLQDKGLIVEKSRGEYFVTFVLTSAAEKLLLDVPDDYSSEYYFPLARDIVEMKAKLREKHG